MDLTKPKYPVVMVVWLDIQCDNSESPAKDEQSKTVVFTYGEIVNESKYNINIAPEYFPGDDFCRHKTTLSKKRDIVLMRSIDGEILIDNRNDPEMKYNLELIGGNY